MTAEELFNKHTQIFYHIDNEKGIELMDKERFIAALTEALCCGQVEPQVSDAKNGHKCAGCGEMIYYQSYCDHCNHLWET